MSHGQYFAHLDLQAPLEDVTAPFNELAASVMSLDKAFDGSPDFNYIMETNTPVADIMRQAGLARQDQTGHRCYMVLYCIVLYVVSSAYEY